MKAKLAAALALLCLFLAACRPTTQNAAANQLHFAIPGDPPTFDPLVVTESNAGTIRDLTAGYLLRINRDTDEPQADLAESWQTKDDDRAIAFHLRKDLKFSDGSPLTANQVAQTLRRLATDSGTMVGDAFREGRPEISVSAPLDLEVRFRTSIPRLERLFDQFAIAPAAPAKLPASAGPFFVDDFKPGAFVHLTRNSNYWKRPLPRLDSIRVDIQSSHEIELKRFNDGDFQVIDRLEPGFFERIAKPGAARDLGASLDSEFLWFNQSDVKTLPDFKRTWFRSAKFRHAISAAIHREDIIGVVYKGHAHAAAGPISTANHAWFNTALQPLTADPQAALRSLEAEGFTLRDSILRDRSGHPVEFTLITNAGNTARDTMSKLIKADLAKLGIDVKTVPLDSRSLGARIGGTLEYEAVLYGFSNTDPDPVNEMNVWLSSKDMHAWWPNQKTPATPWEKRIDELEDKQVSEPSREARKKALDEFQQIVRDQEPIIYLVNPDYLVAISPLLKGMQPGVAPPQLWRNVEQISF